ncbi:hypothetical protein C8R46DRAFT_1000879 [Mycena filopes]|nr:hypothetical protein C8R46DRAFT_1000879 [Mycena filopes]
MTFTESTSALLVVCKSWLRVATPLLYHVVILRSKAQAQALAATLKANPELGGFIRKLRAEGGYAISMFKILQASTKITDLFLCVDLSSADNACGFCKGLHLLDPVRIILTNMHPWGGGATKNGQKLVEALEKCVRTWKKLAVFQLDHTLGVAEGGLATALSEAPNLSTVVVSDHRRYLRQVPEYMRLIAKNPALKLIRLDPPANYALDANPLQSRHQFYNDAESDNTLSALLDLANLRRAVPAPDPTEPDDGPSIPFVYPARLAADPVQEDVIWSRVLYFALYDDPSIPRYVFSHSSPVFTPLLVCKLFQRIGTPHLYESPFLSTEHASNIICIATCDDATARQLRPMPDHWHRQSYILVQNNPCEHANPGGAPRRPDLSTHNLEGV